MGRWICTECGLRKESRCKPRKCPACGEKDSFEKEEEEETRGEKN